MEQPVLVYTTYPSIVEADAAGQGLVDRGLAACVNIIPGMRSIYRWEGTVERAEEAVMIVKTRTSMKQAVAEAVRDSHPYETPAILFLDVAGGDPRYLAWILEESSGRPVVLRT
jgi:periplasmic divalent cation tolerance protein